MPVLTIAQELGSGPEVGSIIAEQLVMPCFGKEIVCRAAERFGYREASLREIDERRPSMLRYLIDMMGAYGSGYGTYQEWAPHTLAIMEGSKAEPPLSPKRAKEAIEETIRSIAATGNAVIIGRGSQVILRDHPLTIHVRVVAPLEYRIGEVMKLCGLDRPAATKLVIDDDRQKAGYMKAHYGVDPEDASLYDLVINTARLPVYEVIPLIKVLVRRLAGTDEGMPRITSQKRRNWRVIRGASA